MVVDIYLDIPVDDNVGVPIYVVVSDITGPVDTL